MPGLLSTAELAKLQTDFANAVCDKPCTIQRRTTTSGSAGEPVGSYNTIATVNAGMSQPTGGQLANYAYIIESLATWQVRLPYGTDVKAQDRLVIEGQTLVVQVVLDPHSYPVLLTVLASEVK